MTAAEVVEEVYVSRDLSAIRFERASKEKLGRGPTLRERDWIFVGYRVAKGGKELWLSKLGTPLSRKPASVEAAERRIKGIAQSLRRTGLHASESASRPSRSDREAKRTRPERGGLDAFL